MAAISFVFLSFGIVWKRYELEVVYELWCHDKKKIATNVGLCLSVKDETQPNVSSLVCLYKFWSLITY